MKRIMYIGLALFITLAAGCATSRVAEKRVHNIWQEVSAQFPDSNVDMPRVVWVDKDIYISRDGADQFVNGAYLESSNTVYLREWWADEGTIEHEFLHAHGLRQGESPGRMYLR